MNHLPAHSTRRLAAWQRAGSPGEYVEFLAAQWTAYDAEHNITVHDRAFSLVTYQQHQDRFTAYVESRYPEVVA